MEVLIVVLIFIVVIVAIIAHSGLPAFWLAYKMIQRTPNKQKQPKEIMSEVDKMEGTDFEKWCADLLRKKGFTEVEVTGASGDQGVDIVAHKDGKKYAVQCKRYSQKLNNRAVQAVNTGKSIYHCDFAIVMTNNYFTAGAVEAAKATDVLLWDRKKLEEMLGS